MNTHVNVCLKMMPLCCQTNMNIGFIKRLLSTSSASAIPVNILRMKSKVGSYRFGEIIKMLTNRPNIHAIYNILNRIRHSEPMMIQRLNFAGKINHFTDYYAELMLTTKVYNKKP